MCLSAGSRLWPGLSLALALALCRAALAQADDVQRYLTAASRLYESLEYERALEQLERAKKLSPGVDDDVMVALYEGIIRADMGQKEEALAAFKTGLFLQPDAKLPVKVSPTVEKAFEALRVDVKRELAPILARQEAERKRKATQAAVGDRPVKDAVTVAAIDPHRTAEADPFKPAIESKRSRVPVAPLVILGIGAVVGGAGAFFGSQSQSSVNAARGAVYRDETIAHLRSAESSATLANILFAGAGAAGVTALIAFFASGDDASVRVREAGGP